MILAFSLLAQIQEFFTNLDASYVDLFKIFAGCIGWIGSLTMFVWMRDKKRQVAKA